MFTKEEQRYGRNKSTVISHGFINSGEYRRKFDNISKDKELNKLLYTLAKKMLNHRSGSLYEDMYWIDIDKREIVCEVVDSTVESKIEYTSRIRKIVEKKKGLLTIHSHPNSFPPSLDDFNSACTNGYGVGIVCGHNGSIFVYHSNEIIPEESYYFLMSDFQKAGYNAYDSQLLTLKELSQRYEIVCRKVGV